MQFRSGFVKFYPQFNQLPLDSNLNINKNHPTSSKGGESHSDSPESKNDRLVVFLICAPNRTSSEPRYGEISHFNITC